MSENKPHDPAVAAAETAAPKIKVYDATPPDDFPDQVIIQQDAAFAARHPDAAYWLRVKRPGNAVEPHQLPGAVCLAEARQKARELGFDPTHWTLPGSSIPHLF